MVEEFRDVLFGIAGAWATLMLNRPAKLNAVTPPMTDPVGVYADRLNADRAVSAVFLGGAV